jgi:hypothetical protein
MPTSLDLRVDGGRSQRQGAAVFDPDRPKRDVQGQPRDFLEAAYRQRNGWLWLLLTPYFAPIQDDPRYDDLTRRMGCPKPD